MSSAGQISPNLEGRFEPVQRKMGLQGKDKPYFESGGPRRDIRFLLEGLKRLCGLRGRLAGMTKAKLESATLGRALPLEVLIRVRPPALPWQL